MGPRNFEAAMPANNHRFRALAIAGASLITPAGLIAGNAVSADGTPPSTTEPLDIEETRDMFTIEDTTFSLADGAATNTLQIGTLEDGSQIVVPKFNSLLPVDSTVRDQDHKLNTLNIANPLTSDQADEEALEAELGATLLEDPLANVMVANFFANSTINGVNMVEANPWLAEYAGDPSTINDNAAELAPGFGQETQTDAEYQASIEAQRENQRLAELNMSIIDQFENLGVQQDQNIDFNYQLTTIQAGQIPEVGIGEPYVGDTLEFAAYTKKGDCIANIGFNIDDQRIVVVPNEVCAPIDNPNVPTTTTTPGETTVPGTTTPGTTPNTTAPGTTAPGTTTPNTTSPSTVPSTPPTTEVTTTSIHGPNGTVDPGATIPPQPVPTTEAPAPTTESTIPVTAPNGEVPTTGSQPEPTVSTTPNTGSVPPNTATMPTQPSN